MASLSAHPGEGFTILEWSPPEHLWELPVLGYMVYRTDPSGAGGDELWEEVQGDTRLEVDGLENGRSYRFGVSALTKAGEGPLRYISTMPVGPPEAPFGPRVLST